MPMTTSPSGTTLIAQQTISESSYASAPTDTSQRLPDITRSTRVGNGKPRDVKRITSSHRTPAKHATGIPHNRSRRETDALPLRQQRLYAGRATPPPQVDRVDATPAGRSGVPCENSRVRLSTAGLMTASSSGNSTASGRSSKASQLATASDRIFSITAAPMPAGSAAVRGRAGPEGSTPGDNPATPPQTAPCHTPCNPGCAGGRTPQPRY